MALINQLKLLYSVSSFSNRFYDKAFYRKFMSCRSEFGLDQSIRIQRQGCNSEVERREAEKSSDIET